MSKITTVYNAVKSSLAGVFPSHIRLPNPYDIEANPLMGRSLYGFKIDDGNQETLEFCNYSIDRRIIIVLVERHVMNEGRADGFDIASLALLENTNLVLKEFLNSSELGISSSIERISLGSASAIKSLNNNDESFLFTEISFNILISESL